jgi:oxygen-dependent protoporphyrinogen oxidase
MASLVQALAASLRGRGVDIRLSTSVEDIDRDADTWLVHAGGQSFPCDAVVLATPAPVTARLLQPHDDEAGGLLDAIDYASVVLVTFLAAADDVPALSGTGFLVPRASRPREDRDAWAVTACTYLDRKWPHLAREGEVLLRASLGRIDDERPSGWTDGEVSDRAWRELGELLGVTGAPKEAMVTRHPAALPQYRVHHLLRTAAVEATVARIGGLVVAGAAYHGVGIPACIASGRSAARALL